MDTLNRFAQIVKHLPPKGEGLRAKVSQAKVWRLLGEGTLDRIQKIRAAQRHVREQIADIIARNFGEPVGALETAGTFTALLEAHQAIEIALHHERTVGMGTIEDGD